MDSTFYGKVRLVRHCVTGSGKFFNEINMRIYSPQPAPLDIQALTRRIIEMPTHGYEPTREVATAAFR